MADDTINNTAGNVTPPTNASASAAKQKLKAEQERYWSSNMGVMAIQGMAMRGLSESEIADVIGMTPAEFLKFRDDYIEVANAALTGWQRSVDVITGSAFKRAQGYDVHESKVVEIPGKDPITTTTTKHVDADASLIKYLLTNMSSDYKDEQDGNETRIKVDLGDLTDDQLAKLAGGDL